MQQRTLFFIRLSQPADLASIENGKIQGIFEHHTSNLVDGKSLERYIKRLASGEITNKEVYDDNEFLFSSFSFLNIRFVYSITFPP